MNTAANKLVNNAVPSTLGDTAKLSTPQVQLHKTRSQFRALFTEPPSNSFPRSATMKFLFSAGGQKAMGLLIGGPYAAAGTSRLGGMVRSAVFGLLVKKIWSRMRR